MRYAKSATAIVMTRHDTDVPIARTPSPPDLPHTLTSGLVELQGDVSVEPQAEVVIEDIQRQL